MLRFTDKIEYIYSNCQQCGTCLSACPCSVISFKLRKDGTSDILIDGESCIKCRKCVRLCPSNSFSNLNETGFFNELKKKQYYLGWNKDLTITRNASSGGVARTLIVEGLRVGFLDGVYGLKKSKVYPYAEGEYYSVTNQPSYDNIPNSVYHSVMLNKDAGRVKKCATLMIVGTPCQLKNASKLLKGKYDRLIKVAIFCKQQKSFNSTRFFAKMLGEDIDIDREFTFSYRGSGWPGVVKINESGVLWDTAARFPFGRRLWSVKGCNICDDPFGKGADITLMDPWVIDKANDLGKTLVISHTFAGEELLKNISELELQTKSYEEVVKALGLEDIKKKIAMVSYYRKERCSSRIKLAGRLEAFQRWYTQGLLLKFPRLPLMGYKLLYKIPDLRNLVLKK